MVLWKPNLNMFFLQNMKGTMNDLITKMKMVEHERDKAVNLDVLKHNGELERGT